MHSLRFLVCPRPIQLPPPTRTQTDDIAVDWVNDKLYWTESVLGTIMVLDMKLRKTKLLIDNGRGSATKAIAVDPTAG